MGYNAFVFKLQAQPWLDAGWLKPGVRQRLVENYRRLARDRIS